MARGVGDSEGEISAPRALDPEAILACLNRHHVRFVVIGAFGAVVQGWEETTHDIDITPDRDAGNLQRLATALRDMDAQPLTDEGAIDPSWPIDDQQLRMRGTTYFRTRHGNIDVVINPAGANGYPDLVKDSFAVSLGDGKVSFEVVRLERIIESKRASDRPKDRAAMPRLEQLLEGKRRGSS